MTFGGQISGTITDIHENPISDVRVEAWSDSIQSGKEVQTDSSGNYSIMGLKMAPDYKCYVSNYLNQIRGIFPELNDLLLFPMKLYPAQNKLKKSRFPPERPDS
ncbi:hypothetical protein MHK_000453 [Candidatus Magnetomorum sp. HK-1]|nr:hypothetical protein MHK_000453 [Candidatus Magnetomorum sp. HK-1]